MSRRARIAVLAAVGIGAYFVVKKFTAPILPNGTLGEDDLKFNLGAVLVENELDRLFGTHDPAKIPNYTAVVLKIGAALGQKLS